MILSLNSKSRERERERERERKRERKRERERERKRRSKSSGIYALDIRFGKSAALLVPFLLCILNPRVLEVT